ncbi:MAG: PDZ domain-containing protein [Planctomycetota bacterium]|nr:MAG: PDZ domain-containing protein [Planctomycetota bacterium]
MFERSKLLMPLMVVLLALVPLWAQDTEEPKPFPRMAEFIGEVIRQHYYDQDRVQPLLMLERGLRAMEQSEIALKAAWDGNGVSLRVAQETSYIEAAEPTDLAAVASILEQVRQRLEIFDFTPQQRRSLAYAMLNGALMSLDPHTVIMPPERATAFSEEISGEFFGVGAYLSQEHGIIRIDRVMPGLPAEQAGIQDGDIILAVDGEPTVGLSLSQAVSRIRGPKGTEVVLTVERTGEDDPLEIRPVRNLIEPPTLVSYQREGVGYVRLDDFNRNSHRQLAEALLQMHGDADHGLRGLVLDLRFNGGGLLKQAYMIADMFLPHSLDVVRTVRLGQSPQTLRSGRRQILEEVPIMVLIGPGSASASEILAGALQLNERAVVAGMSSFGKGSVQTIRPLPDESNLKYTIQEYQLKGGASIQGQGIQPDLIYLRHSMDADGNVDLVPYSMNTEADNEFALSPLAAEPLRQAPLSLGWLADFRDEDALRRSRISARDFTPDQEAALTIDLLSHVVNDEDMRTELSIGWLEQRLRSATIDALREAVAQRSTLESQRLSEALAAMDPPITWGEATAVDPSDLALRYLGPESVTPGEEVRLRFAVDNHGSEDVGRIYGIIRADPASPLWESELLIGAVAAGESTEGTVRFRVPQRLYYGHEAFSMELRQDGKVEPLLEKPVSIHIADAPRPHFSWEWSVRDDGVTRRGGLALDQPYTLQLTITNDGDGSTLPFMVYVFKDDDPFVSLDRGRFQLEALEPGASRTVQVPFTVTSSPPRGYQVSTPPESIALQVHAEEEMPRGRDGRFRERFHYSINLPVGDDASDAPLLAAVSKPFLAIESVTYHDAVAEVALRIQDDNLRYLAVFENKRKTALTTYEDEPVATTKTLRIQLEEGLNDIRIHAQDADEVTSSIPLRLWGPEITLAGRTAASPQDVRK